MDDTNDTITTNLPSPTVLPVSPPPPATTSPYLVLKRLSRDKANPKEIHLPPPPLPAPPQASPPLILLGNAALSSPQLGNDGGNKNKMDATVVNNHNPDPDGATITVGSDRDHANVVLCSIKNAALTSRKHAVLRTVLSSTTPKNYHHSISHQRAKGPDSQQGTPHQQKKRSSSSLPLSPSSPTTRTPSTTQRRLALLVTDTSTNGVFVNGALIGDGNHKKHTAPTASPASAAAAAVSSSMIVPVGSLITFGPIATELTYKVTLVTPKLAVAPKISTSKLPTTPRFHSPAPVSPRAPSPCTSPSSPSPTAVNNNKQKKLPIDRSDTDMLTEESELPAAPPRSSSPLGHPNNNNKPSGSPPPSSFSSSSPARKSRSRSPLSVPNHHHYAKPTEASKQKKHTTPPTLQESNPSVSPTASPPSVTTAPNTKNFFHRQQMSKSPISSSRSATPPSPRQSPVALANQHVDPCSSPRSIPLPPDNATTPSNTHQKPPQHHQRVSPPLPSPFSLPEAELTPSQISLPSDAVISPPAGTATEGRSISLGMDDVDCKGCCVDDGGSHNDCDLRRSKKKKMDDMSMRRGHDQDHQRAWSSASPSPSRDAASSLSPTFNGSVAAVGSPPSSATMKGRVSTKSYFQGKRSASLAATTQQQHTPSPKKPQPLPRPLQQPRRHRVSDVGLRLGETGEPTLVKLSDGHRFGVKETTDACTVKTPSSGSSRNEAVDVTNNNNNAAITNCGRARMALETAVQRSVLDVERNTFEQSVIDTLMLAYDPVADAFSHSKESIEAITAGVSSLCRKLRKFFRHRPLCVQLRSPLLVFGDLHGSFADLKYIFSKSVPFGSPRFLTTPMLFLGDYVDRGPHSVEVVLFLFSLQLLCPKQITLLRGNHEDPLVNGDVSQYGQGSFLVKCRELFGDSEGTEVWESVNEVFASMPVCAVVDDDIFAAHGGVPKILPEDGASSCVEPSTATLENAPALGPSRSVSRGIPLSVFKQLTSAHTNPANPGSSPDNFNANTNVASSPNNDSSESPNTCESSPTFTTTSAERQENPFPHFTTLLPHQTDSPTVAIQRRLIRELAWNDPVSRKKSSSRHTTSGSGFLDTADDDLWDQDGFRCNQGRGDTSGVILEFSQDAAHKFMDANGWSIMLRAHQHKGGGMHLAHSARIITIFTASNYSGCSNAAGACLVAKGKVQMVAWDRDAIAASFSGRGTSNTDALFNGDEYFTMHSDRRSAPSGIPCVDDVGDGDDDLTSGVHYPTFDDTTVDVELENHQEENVWSSSSLSPADDEDDDDDEGTPTPSEPLPPPPQNHQHQHQQQQLLHSIRTALVNDPLCARALANSLRHFPKSGFPPAPLLQPTSPQDDQHHRQPFPSISKTHDGGRHSTTQRPFNVNVALDQAGSAIAASFRKQLQAAGAAQQQQQRKRDAIAKSFSETGQLPTTSLSFSSSTKEHLLLSSTCDTMIGQNRKLAPALSRTAHAPSAVERAKHHLQLAAPQSSTSNRNHQLGGSASAASVAGTKRKRQSTEDDECLVAFADFSSLSEAEEDDLDFIGGVDDDDDDGLEAAAGMYADDDDDDGEEGAAATPVDDPGSPAAVVEQPSLCG